MNFSFSVLALTLTGWLSCVSLSASEWTRFRGPNGSGVSEGAALPSEFGPAKNLVWRTSVPLGHSSPAVGAGSIFLTGFEGDKLLTIALDRRSGEMQWRREILRKREGQLHEDNTPASPSPATDGENVYVFFQDLGLVSYGPDGGERWRMPLGPFNNLMGLGASPILADGKVIQVCDAESGAFMLAADKDTGEVAWRDERSFVRRGFSTPLLYDPPEGGGLQVLVTGSYRLIAYSVASGKKMWWTRGLTWQQKPTPVKDRDTIYVQNWAGGADLGTQKQVPSFEAALKEHDEDRDGKLSREEAPDPAMTGNWPHFDLDQDGYLGVRDWEQYRNRSASVNSVMAIRLGGEGDMSDSAIKVAISQNPAERSFTAALSGRPLHDERGRHCHQPGPGNGQGLEAGAFARCSRQILRFSRCRRQQDFRGQRRRENFRSQAGGELGSSRIERSGRAVLRYTRHRGRPDLRKNDKSLVLLFEPE